jgi:hypothetical protein
MADESVCIGPPPPPLSYLNMPAIIAAAEVTDAQAIHPGYGFLSENADFAERVEQERLRLHRPAADTIRLMGDKVGHQRDEGRPACPACRAPAARWATTTTRTAHRQADRLPGDHQGLGRRRRPRHARGAPRQRCSTPSRDQAEAGALRQRRRSTWRNSSRIRATSNSRCWPTTTATSMHLGERDCSMQRRHQKVIEEAPAPGIGQDARRRWARRAWKPAKHGLSRRRHLRVPLRGRRVLLHRDEHPHPGGASGHRDGHRHRPGEDSSCWWPPARSSLQAEGHQVPRPRHRMPHQRRGPGHLHALAGPGEATIRRAAPACASTAMSTPATPCRRTTIR